MVNILKLFCHPVHPANSMINRRESVFFQVSRSNYYEVAFTQKKTQLLEAPSKTRCVDYQKSPYFVANNISTRDQCINRCINLYKANERTCANYYSMITLKMVSDDSGHKKICDHEHQVKFLKKMFFCKDNVFVEL